MYVCNALGEIERRENRERKLIIEIVKLVKVEVRRTYLGNETVQERKNETIL